MKLAIVVGHNDQSRGAVRRDTGEPEFAWNSRLASRMEVEAIRRGIEARVFFRTPHGGYSAEIARVYDQVDAWGADASIELHFNSVEDPRATGSEVFSSGTVGSLRLAASVQAAIVGTLGLPDRGVKTRQSDDRGGASLHSGRAPAILIEPYFASNERDLEVTRDPEAMAALARAVVSAAAGATAAQPRRDLSGSRTLAATSGQRRASQMGVLASAGAAIASVGEAVVGDASSAVEAAEIGLSLEPYLPWLAGALGAGALVLWVYNRAQADRIEEARVDDHERAIR